MAVCGRLLYSANHFGASGVLAYKSTLRENRAIVSPEYVNKSNPAGQKSTIFLKDGSQIILNSASRLRYLARFPAHERVIEVYGEAFFEVAKDAGRPFRVLANDAEIIVYGTSFNVRSFADEKEIRIGLVEGKLAVKERTDKGDPVILFPGEGVIYYPHLEEKIVKVDIDIEKLIAWKTGILLFEDESHRGSVKNAGAVVWGGIHYRRKTRRNFYRKVQKSEPGSSPGRDSLLIFNGLLLSMENTFD